MLYIINKNILEFEGYICHQCNCKTEKPFGLSKQIFSKYKYANIYNDGTNRYLGDIHIRNNIINLCAQLYPSKSKYKNDTNDIRINAFKICLDKLKILNNDIAFPYGIGCGLAGGDWNIYYSLIEELSKTVNFDIYICKL
jgi:hypothetical protein